jgi:hypothetical protein
MGYTTTGTVVVKVCAGEGGDETGVGVEDGRECREGKVKLRCGGSKILVKKSAGLMRPGRKTRREKF